MFCCLEFRGKGAVYFLNLFWSNSNEKSEFEAQQKQKPQQEDGELKGSTSETYLLINSQSDL